MRLRPTSAWTGVYKVTVVEISEDDIIVQYQEKDRMVIGGKMDDGLKAFPATQFNDLIVDELPVRADCCTTAGYVRFQLCTSF